MPAERQFSVGDGAPPVLRARIVLPVSRPPIADGAVRISGNRIVWVGRWRDLSDADRGRALDLGKVILLPGLINTHCHLDYTNMAGQIAPPRTFIDWIKLITTGKSGEIYSDFAESWLGGANMLVRTGVTTVGDIEMVHELLPDVWTATPLRVISFLEMTGVKSRRPPAEIVQEALGRIDSLVHERSRAALSPHAPYSTTPELLRLAAARARERKLPLAVHVAESDQEFEMFTKGRGAMFEWIARNGRDMSDCGLGSPVQHLERAGALGGSLLAIHANYLARGDARLLGRRKVSVVHCPRSHAYFKHRKFPLRELTAARVNICLGTDSLASVYKRRGQTIELNLFEEMRALAVAEPSLAPKKIVRMATVNGARALDLAGQVGEISPGAFADMIAIPFTRKVANSWAAILEHRGDVAASMIDGQWAVAPQSLSS
jgi:cytosine/adenosine deaminase-related metal-dependent hydrolase